MRLKESSLQNIAIWPTDFGPNENNTRFIGVPSILVNSMFGILVIIVSCLMFK